MAYWADDVAAYLITQGVGTALGTDVFVGRLPDPNPDNTDNIVGVFERPGAPPLMTLTGMGAASVAPPEEKTSRPRMTVRVRHDTYDGGRTMIYNAFKALHGKTNTVLGAGTVTFNLISAVQSPTHIGLDEVQRHEWVVNFDCSIQDNNR